MSASVLEMEVPDAADVVMSQGILSVVSGEGSTISAPLDRHPRLVHATESERADWRLVGRGHGIHWDDIDKDVSVEGLLAGNPSAQSRTSLERWLRLRQPPDLR